MNDERLDRLLADFLDARQAEILAAARGPREAALRTRKVVAVQTRLGLRRASALTALLLILLLAMLLAAFAGADPFRRSDPLPGNGLITFGLHDLTQRPYTTIHVVAADGTEEHAVEPGYAQRYSAGGQILAYWAGPWPEEVLTIARPDGSSPQQVPGIAGGGDFSLSPDGTRIAWVKRVASREIAREDGGGERWPVSELWVMPLDGGQGTLVADTSVAPDGHISTPAWSPAGDVIAFAVNVIVDDGTGSFGYRSAIDIVRPDGSDLHRLTSRPGSDVVGLAWSPDGRYLAFTAAPDSGSLTSPMPDGLWSTYADIPLNDIFVVAEDGRGERNLSHSADEDWGPTWAPDGSRVAWVSGSTSRLLILGMDGSRPTGEAAAGPIVGDAYAWSPDGTRIAFSSYEDPGSRGISGGQILEAAIASIRVDDLQASPTPVLEVDHLVEGLSWQPLEVETREVSAVAGALPSADPVGRGLADD